MDKVVIIISLAWFAHLFVDFWTGLTSKTNKLITMKPFSCQSCMGFWIGLTYSYFNSESIIIFACMTSLTSYIIDVIKFKIF